MSTETIKYIRCPECGWIGELDECEVTGAEEGNVFCGRPPHTAHRCNWWPGVEMQDRDSPRTNTPGCGAEIAVKENLFVPNTTSCETQGTLF